MISVQEAQTQILSHTFDAPPISLAIQDLGSEVLRQNLYADRNYPPFHRVAMDGIAISLKAWTEGLREFVVQDIQRAGVPAMELLQPQNCIEVMTGAVLPKGCDAVIRYEDVEINASKALVKVELNLSSMYNVHQEGSDYQAGDVLVKAGQVLEAPHWSIAASVGEAEVQVSRRPKIAIVSTGDELIEVDEKPKAYQIRRSNAYTLLASCRKNGFYDVKMEHIRDNPEEVRRTLQKILGESDILILSGGVSMGKFDFVPSTLTELGIQPVFHKIRQKPGKPFWFGVSEKKQMVFALPGNPVSALVCFHRYVLQALNKTLGHDPNYLGQAHAVLEEKVSFKKPLTYFLPVQVRSGEDGMTYAKPVKSNGSGDFASLGRSQGFIELSADEETFLPGKAYPLYYW